MSTNYLLRNGMIAALGITGLTLSACASGHNSGRYASVNDFESGGSNCGVTSSCDGGAVYSAHNFESGSRYGSSHSGHNIFNYEGVPGNCGTSGCAPVAPAPVYADCGQIGQMACGDSSVQMYEPAPAPVYVAPEPAYTAPATTSYSGATSYSSSASVECPAGTTLQSDNTCLQGSSSYSTGVISSGTTSSYSSGTVSSYPSTTSYSSSHSSGGNVSCPSGTTLQSDNTCLQVSGSSVISSGTSYSSGTTYSSGTSYTGSTSSSSTASCPSGTVMQGDGSCMTVGYSSSTYTQSDYMPIRK